ncbi:MAG: methionine biosynthesis protein MetW [Alphaproteobacteria bacterium]|nr:MAG: methionine biosynthesis protein MetW [Alphaproteobacteria bacterium]
MTVISDDDTLSRVSRPQDIRVDLLLIARAIPPGSRVLDVGCGDGALMDYLVRERDADARGIELSQEGVNACVARGLSVVQGDADTDLKDYPSKAFDYVILSQTLQATRKPKEVIRELLRIGRHAIVSFPNFGFWKVRAKLFFGGRMPNTGTLDHPWYDTPNIHLCTVRDFVELCESLDVTIEESLAIDSKGRPMRFASRLWLANLFADQGLFVLRKNDS